jgi:hypothetical protein
MKTFPEIHLLPPRRRGPVCGEAEGDIYMTEDERLVTCRSCLSAWQRHQLYKGRIRFVAAGRATE